MTAKEQRRENYTYRERCRGKLTKSKIPRQVKATLHLLLDYMGSASDYTTAWVSHKILAEQQGLSERTIERHCKAIEDAGLLIVEQLGVIAARQRLKQEFGYTLKGFYAHSLTFYTINPKNPLWGGQDQTAIAATEKQARDALPKRKKTASGASSERSETRQRCRLRPDNVVAPKPDNVVGLPSLQEEASQVASSNPLDPSEGRTLPGEERGRSSSETRATQEANNLEADAIDSFVPQSPASLPAASLTDAVANGTCREWIAGILYRLNVDNPNHFKDSSGDWDKTAAQIDELSIRLRKVRGRHPTSDEGYAALCSEEFQGLRKFSWGWLCSRARDENGNVGCHLDRWEVEIVKQMETTDKAMGTPSIQRNYALEQALELQRTDPDNPELAQLVDDARKMGIDSESYNHTAAWTE
jgi:hypothetical protein